MKRQMTLLLIGAALVILLISISFLVYIKRLHRSASHFQTIGEYVQQGKLDEAVAVLKESLSKNHFNAEAHAALGMIYNKKDLLDDALTELKTALTINPDLISIYQEMYLIYKKKGMEDEADRVLASYERLKESK
ncbi:MAG: tetratricopeptide repeat protein [Candidatus Brocadia sp.]|nr:tetratricopeptide repeat protein [Candidatus Brocadia sp.]MDG6026508.1 tetratricopeptide repeat protein [Candidatus Brocadia sp.]